MAHASSVAETAWVEAKQNSDFQMLLPHLARNVELTKRYAECYEGFPGFAHTYDALLDEYEPEMTTEQMRAVLTGLREGLVPLVREAADSGAGRVEDPFAGDFPVDRQVEQVAEMLSELPFPEDAWRIDPTEHPFALSIGRGDVRLTTRYDESNLAMSLFSAMHEAGHGLYESGVDAELRRTPLAKPRSLGLHESQSRLWENWVARSRPYLERLLPRLRERFPGGFDEVEADELYRGANRVEPSLIRIEADEVTYNLHILIRFELELEIFEGGLELDRAPRGVERPLPRVPRHRGPRRRPWRAAGRALAGRRVRILPHLQPRQHHRRAALGGGRPRPRRSGLPNRRRRPESDRRVAARSRPSSRPSPLPSGGPGASRLRRALRRASAQPPERPGRAGCWGVGGRCKT